MLKLATTTNLKSEDAADLNLNLRSASELLDLNNSTLLFNYKKEGRGLWPGLRSVKNCALDLNYLKGTTLVSNDEYSFESSNESKDTRTHKHHSTMLCDNLTTGHNLKWRFKSFQDLRYFCRAVLEHPTPHKAPNLVLLSYAAATELAYCIYHLADKSYTVRYQKQSEQCMAKRLAIDRPCTKHPHQEHVQPFKSSDLIRNDLSIFSKFFMKDRDDLWSNLETLNEREIWHAWRVVKLYEMPRLSKMEFVSFWQQLALNKNFILKAQTPLLWHDYERFCREFKHHFNLKFWNALYDSEIILISLFLYHQQGLSAKVNLQSISTIMRALVLPWNKDLALKA